MPTPSLGFPPIRNRVITMENPVTETQTLTLPLLPLPNGVVLPQMVVTLAIESAEAAAAVEGAETADRLVLLVPRVDSRYAAVGTVARIESSGELPGGERALVLRGLRRAAVRAA